LRNKSYALRPSSVPIRPTAPRQFTYIVHPIPTWGKLFENDNGERVGWRRKRRRCIISPGPGESYPRRGASPPTPKGAVMQKTRALLVYADAEPLQSLKLALQGLAVETDCAPTCQQARNILKRATEPPDIIFTDTVLPDGTWQELLAMARDIQGPSKVIVVSRTEDPWLYLDAMERGAFDFILPPFATADLGHILRCATSKRAEKAVWAA